MADARWTGSSILPRLHHPNLPASRRRPAHAMRTARRACARRLGDPEWRGLPRPGSTGWESASLRRRTPPADEPQPQTQYRRGRPPPAAPPPSATPAPCPGAHGSVAGRAPLPLPAAGRSARGVLPCGPAQCSGKSGANPALSRNCEPPPPADVAASQRTGLRHVGNLRGQATACCAGRPPRSLAQHRPLPASSHRRGLHGEPPSRG